MNLRVLHVVIVAFIVLIVGSLLIVAIGKVREAANKTECANNLKQVGLAVHNYRDTFRYFPPAGKINANLPVEKRLGWLYLIVPFVESDNIYRQIDQDQAWDSEKNRAIPLIVWHRVYQCPSYLDRPPNSKFIPTHYLGITGVETEAATLPLDDPKAGFFGYERKLKEEDIKRGLSNTLATAETAWAGGAWTAAPDSVHGVDAGGSPYLGVPQQFGGNHPSGANVLFADGSVRFLENSFDPQEFERMATISRGTPPSSPP
jgi:prepilin-type processing-associated H-X9-DG protein